jgi:hypothetical protein
MRYSSITLTYPYHREWDMHDSCIPLSTQNHRA